VTDERADFIRQETEDAARDEQASKAKGPIDDDDQPFDLGEWDFGEDNEPIPPRGWLLGNLLCRQFLSAIFGDGAVGKTALIIAMALSLAADRNLIGEHVFLRCRVLLICFEDGKAELRRRLTAAMLHYGISKADIRGHLFIATVNRSDAKLAHSKNGEVTVGKLRDALDQSIVRRNADATFLDPLVKAHAVGENNNSEIDFVAEILGELSVKHDCSFCSPHHTRKGPAEPGNADIGRGAGSLKDAFRLCYTLTAISKEEADRFAIGAEERASLIRLDSGKVNLVRRSANARWFKLVGVPLGNKTELYPSGDEIQTVERWNPPDLFQSVSNITWNEISHRDRQGFAKRPALQRPRQSH
jgi:RecA-family ATPase